MASDRKTRYLQSYLIYRSCQLLWYCASIVVAAHIFLAHQIGISVIFTHVRYYSHTLTSPRERWKTNSRTLAARRVRYVIVSACRISAYSGFSGSLFHIFQYKWGIEWWARKRIHYSCEDGIENPSLRPSRLPIVITRQASWCQSMILGTDFSIPPSHSWWILIFPSRY